MFGQIKIVEVDPDTEIECPETKRVLVVTDSQAVEVAGTLYITPMHVAAFNSIANKREPHNS
ncbi:hypothetical protein SAMN05444000_105200 [Shimia gijangensis]|uniref:Uncharacterized protein n=1 Tax=Shimia gijangensis TaxID=1470563 RepID=A0A1M6H203_9RHOB|nr:hypothetical protein SAMN05444000_105200 [Shimia gijangensis]